MDYVGTVTECAACAVQLVEGQCLVAAGFPVIDPAPGVHAFQIGQ